MLVKMTVRGRDFPTAVARARRGLAEFRIRGVTTNISFVQAVLADPAFQAGDLSTKFIEERPELFQVRESRDRGTKILNWLADVTVNRPNGDGAGLVDPALKLPVVDIDSPAPAGSRQRLLELGPAGFAAALRAQTQLAVTETTFRDAHQSLLATRVRTKDLVAVLPAVARMTPGLLSVEAWGGATYDVALRFLGEDPWERLTAMREALPNIAIQMLLRGRNTVGYTPYPTEVTDAFVREAAASGVDIFRIFDALNDVDQMKPAIDAVLATGTAVAEVAMCYTGDLLNPDEDLYTLDYYLRLAEQMVEAGAHILGIKDMAGLLRAGAAEKLVTALRERFDLPVHVHTHDTAGGQLATLLAASRAGADAVDAASAPMAGTTSQPSLSALVAATAHTDRDTGLSLDAVSNLEPYWEAVRKVYRPFESGLPGPTGRVYRHEIPGGQLSNLRQQAIALGLGDQFEKVEDWYAAANRILGRPPKVTPSSKVVGDLALMLAAADADPDDFEKNPDKYDIPDSVIGFMAGELGDLPGGWPEPFRTKVLAGPQRQDRGRRGLGRGPGRARRQLRRPARRAEPAALPGADAPVRAGARAVRRPVACRHDRLPLRPAAGRRACGRDQQGSRPAADARGDRAARRQGHAHRDDHDQRPAAAGRRARPQHRRRQQGRREGRPDQAGTGGRSVLGRGDAQDLRGRRGRRGSAGRVDRGHEDGGRDHHAGRGHGRATRHPGHAAGGCRRPAGCRRVSGPSRWRPTQPSVRGTLDWNVRA